MKLIPLILLIYLCCICLYAQTIDQKPDRPDALDADTTYQNPGVVNNLPVFYKKLADRITFPISWLSGNFNDFTEWRQTAREKVMQSLLYTPPAVPFEAVIIAEEDRGSYVARKVVLNISADSRILSYLLVPKGEGPFPGALLLHDHSARFDIGKEKMVRPFDVPKKPIRVFAAVCK
jgi:hypothetical protein